MRNLILILGDQLDVDSAAFDGFDKHRDAVWMAEVTEESTKVWSSKMRTAFFLSAMRHFSEALRKKGYRVLYHLLGSEHAASFTSALAHTLAAHPPEKLILVQPGEYGVESTLRNWADSQGVVIEFREDRHFLCTPAMFHAHASGRKQLRMEYFYREMRKRTGLLMEGDQPVGGAWNFDPENRGSFGKKGPGNIPSPMRFPPDAITREVMAQLEIVFPDHPGSAAAFCWPVTRTQAVSALQDFCTHRLPLFGQYQDAMWTEQPWLYHSLISAALNVKLLHPMEVCLAAEQAWRDDPQRVPLNAVEGFIRQIIGWREYVRGVYQLHMPAYIDRNAMGAKADLPDFYWTGNTEMHCLSEAISQTLRHGYAHHIQRLMVTGLFSLLYGVDPKQIHAWYLAVYVDAVEWVELPNTLGMSQYADGGIMGSKPYVASGKYIQRMSNYCTNCRYDPAQATGENACPFTTLYWEYLDRHQQKLNSNPRMRMQLKNLVRKSEEDRIAIREHAALIRGTITGTGSRPG